MKSTATAPARQLETGLAAESLDLIRTISLEVQPMTRESFAPYGELLGERGEIAIDLDGGPASVATETVEARSLRFDFLGRHQKTEQVVSPIGGTQSIIAVAPSSEENPNLPDVERLAAFLIDGTSAFKLHRGIWHTSAFPLAEQATFLVLDRERTLEDDYDLRDLKTSLGVIVEINR